MGRDRGSVAVGVGEETRSEANTKPEHSSFQTDYLPGHKTPHSFQQAYSARRLSLAQATLRAATDQP